jgi:hypothetical protein
MNIQRKACNKCKEEKDFDEFFKENRSKDGRRNTCKSCCKIWASERKERNIKQNEEMQEDKTRKKVCTKCQKDKIITEFYVRRESKDGRETICKSCCKRILEAVKNERNVSKTCNKCNEEKLVEEFFTDKSKKDGKRTICKLCCKKIQQEIQKKNLETKKPAKGNKVCSKCFKDKPVTDYYRENTTLDGFKAKCKECSENDKAIYKKYNGEKIKEQGKKYSQTERAKMLRTLRKGKNRESGRKWREKNKELIRRKDKVYRQNNRYKINRRVKIRLLTSPQAKLGHNLRARFHDALKRNCITKKCSVINLIGCSIMELKEHLSKIFKEGMCWENYGKWHIDHILPIASFDLTDIEQQKKCFHFTNLQPLWAEENLKKGKK